MKTIKKTKFVALFLVVTFLSINLKAQWFGEIRHNFNKSTFSNGKLCFSWSLGAPPTGPWGFIRSGYWPSSPVGSPNFEFSYMNNQGAYGPGTFYGEYSIFDDAASCSSPVKKNNCNGVFVVNAANTGGAEVFALAGVYDEGLFFSTINVAGAPVRTYRWDWPYPVSQLPKKPFVSISPTKLGVFYITGDFDNMSYVINVDASTNPATVNWANFYASGDSLGARALMESPYNSNEVVVVGSRYGKLANGSKGREAFFMTLGNATGNVIGFNTYSFNSDGEDSWFTSIKQSKSNYGGSPGYLLGGYCYSLRLRNTTHPQWMTKLDPTGVSLWSSIIEPIYSTNYNQQTTWEINDVQERLNTSNKYENYGIAGSTINNGTTTYDYLSVFKLDQAGTPGILTPTEFRYSNTGRHGVFASCYIEYQENLPIIQDPSRGLDMFAEDFTTQDHTWEQTYFNGVNACTDSTTDIIKVVAGPGIAQNPQVQVTPFQANCPNLFSLQVNFPNDNLMYPCYTTPSVPGGSNARQMATGLATENAAKGSDISVYPNPSNAVVFIKSGDRAQLKNATIRIENHLGQTVGEFSADQILNTNDDGLRIDFNKLNLAGGIYFITISGKQVTTTSYKVVYNKE